MRKTLSVLMTGALIGSLVGCTPKESTPTDSKPKDEKITLNVWHQWANDTNDLKKLYDQAVEKYQKDHTNIVIKTDTLDTEAYKTKISTAFASNTSDVDVFYYWGGGKGKKLAEAGKLLPLDEYINDGTKDKVVGGSLNAFQFDGKTYSLPMFSWNMVLYCNKEIFDQNSVKIPETYDELTDAVKKLSAKGVLPLVVGAKDGWQAGFVYEALTIRTVGAEKVNAFLAGKAGFDDPGYAESAQKLLDLNAAGAFGKSALATSNDEADAAFLGGKAAMRLQGSWLAGGVYTNKDSVVKDKVVPAKIPMITGKGDANEFEGGFIESFFVNNNTKHKKEAVDFCKYIDQVMGNTAAENSLGFTGWKDNIDTSKLNPLMKQIADQVKTSKASVLAWDTSLDEAATTVHLEAVQALFGNKMTPDKFVKAHQDAVKK
jgi:raffinose/stachyose/melibiose transport system substrate-binding protein